MKAVEVLLWVCALIAVACPAFASPFATEVVSAAGSFVHSPYDDPEAALGEPTTWIKGSDVGGDNLAASIVAAFFFPAWQSTHRTEPLRRRR